MIYNEEIKDLFSVDDSYYFAHCISADFTMGKGIAVEFNNRFGMKWLLHKNYPNFYNLFIKDNQGCCIREGRVFNLITKANYYQKPTYKSIYEALEEMRNQALFLNIDKIAMPIIGCGLDKLNWEKVSEIIKEIFNNTNIEILVCRKD